MTELFTIVDFDDWRAQARELLAAGRPPREVDFRAARDRQQRLLAASEGNTTTAVKSATRVPPAFIELAKHVACHRDDDRWNDLYSVLWRLTHDEPRLLDVATDAEVHRLRRREKQVTRDAHKMKAFVRFRKVQDADGELFVAWHRPDHDTLRMVAPFFARRFKGMRWSVLTPYESVVWDMRELKYGPGVPADQAPLDDALEELWKTYYGSIFNPARIKLDMMRREMPARHWRTLPETRIIPELLAEAPRRVESMIQYAARGERGAAAYLPETRELRALAAAAAACRGCDLHARATQTVFGRGPIGAKLMLIGEQPGDQEDLAGEPFVGPAGEVLGEALAAARIARDEVYVTNAVKHFHWEPRGERRLHKKPPARAMASCRPWIEAEFEAVAPRVVVCLGSTAAQVVVGRDTRLTRDRGVFRTTKFCERTLLTWHPSAILRAPDRAAAAMMQEELIRHLRLAAQEAVAA